MSKTVFEQLEEVQKELKDLKEKQKTLVDQLNEDDPIIIEFVNTDFPEPVVPATSKCGIFPISATTTFPAISFPAAKAIFELFPLSSFDSIKSLISTESLPSFVTSIPIVDFPGTGSILMSVAAIFNLISSAKDVILFILVPVSG